MRIAFVWPLLVAASCGYPKLAPLGGGDAGGGGADSGGDTGGGGGGGGTDGGMIDSGPTSCIDLELLAGAIGGPGSRDGSASLARFNYPDGIAADGSGNLYIADGENSTIREISVDGVVSTLAGFTGVQGFADGTGSAARFSFPAGIAVGADGTIYVTDTNNETIRAITPGGTVTTVAGTPGVMGSANGSANAATFNFPRGIAIDVSGALYVADPGNGAIRKIANGQVTTLASGFATPYGVATWYNGVNTTVYVADTGRNALYSVFNGTSTLLAGGASGSSDGAGSAAAFNGPEGIAVDPDGHIFVTDTDNDTIREISSGGTVTTLAGTALAYGSIDGTGSAARFNNPQVITVSPTGVIYVADTANSEIRKVTPSGVVTTLAGSTGVGTGGSLDGDGSAARFNAPNGIAVGSDGTTYVADTDSFTIRTISTSGAVMTLAGHPGIVGNDNGLGSAAYFNYPVGVALGDNELFVTDSRNNSIRLVTLAGDVSTPATAVGFVMGIARDSTGNLFVSAQDTIIEVDGAGSATTVAGTRGSTGSTDGTSALFNNPQGLAVAPDGTVFIADTGNNTIRTLSGGSVTTIAGAAGFSGSEDGSGDVARFSAPQGLALDGSGNLYVADMGNGVIRKVTPDGTVSTVAGIPRQLGIGLGTTPTFGTPRALAVEGTSLVIADGNAILTLACGAQ